MTENEAKYVLTIKEGKYHAIQQEPEQTDFLNVLQQYNKLLEDAFQLEVRAQIEAAQMVLANTRIKCSMYQNILDARQQMIDEFFMKDDEMDIDVNVQIEQDSNTNEGIVAQNTENVYAGNDGNSDEFNEFTDKLEMPETQSTI